MAPKASRRAEILLDAAVIFLLTAALVWPLFKAKYLANWGSIESTYIADARFLVEHWPHPQWQPLWYAGTRLDYVYPPALRYGTALIAKAVGYWPVKAYHVYIALFYCLGIAGVYLLIRAGTGSRGRAWLGAAATALLSPSFLFLKLYRQDSPLWTPQRLHGMVQYGEGAHMAALALIPIALAFTWRALERRRRADIAWAAVFAAAAVSNNFYGAIALALCYAVLAASFWITRREREALLPLVAIPVLAYGLTAFWLVPSYFRITAANLQYVSMPGNAWSAALMVAVAAVFAWGANHLAGKRPEQTWAVFSAGLVIFFLLPVAGNYFFGFRILGEPLRMVPELDLVLILGTVTALAALWRKRRLWARVAAVVVAICGFATASSYLRHAWQVFPLAGNYWDRPEYRIADWVARYMPDARVFPVGSVRFWFDVWHDLPQLGGGSEQGLENDLVEHAQWALRLSPSLELSLAWLQSMAVDAVYVPGPGSLEVYKTDYLHPGKYAGHLEVIYDDHQGNVVYRVPRRFAARARVVETQRLKALHAPRDNWDLANVRAYADVVENGPEAAARLVREGSDALRVQAQVAPGQSLVVQESYDPAWRAWSGGRPVPIHPDAMGMMALEPPPGNQELRLQFTMPAENRIGWGLTGITLMAIALPLLAQRSRTRPPHLPAGVLN